MELTKWMKPLVLPQGGIDGFRATRMIQNKAQSAGNGRPFPRTATPHWIIRVAPFGRAGKRSSAVLRLLARAGHSRRGTPRLKRLLLVRPTASRLAEPVNITLKEYQCGKATAATENFPGTPGMSCSGRSCSFARLPFGGFDLAVNGRLLPSRSFSCF